MSRKRIYEIIEKSEGDDKLSSIYDYSMIVIIVMSLIPLAFKEDNIVFTILDKVSVSVFIVDYFLRWITADYKFGKASPVSFIKYPFSPMAIIDLLSILPSLAILSNGFRVLRVLRMIRVLRVFKALRYSRSIKILRNVLHSSRDSLIAVCALAGGYILISALVIFNVEPETFNTFFDAIYWATVSLTTVGYGDIYPVTTIGRIITMVSAISGVAVVALPAGIITAGYMNELNKAKNKSEDNDNEPEEGEA